MRESMRPRKKVILRRCPDYNPEAIAGIIREGIEEFGLASRLRGRVTIKPNVVFAHHKLAPAAFTRPEFMDGLLTALKDKAAAQMRITVAERCGSAIPTYRMFRRAGYVRLKKSTASVSPSCGRTSPTGRWWPESIREMSPPRGCFSWAPAPRS
jgi:hypothetical protein